MAVEVIRRELFSYSSMLGARRMLPVFVHLSRVDRGCGGGQGAVAAHPTLM